jgi:hypothetical protein
VKTTSSARHALTQFELPVQIIKHPPTDREVGVRLGLDIVRDEGAINQPVDVDVGCELVIVRIERRHFRQDADPEIGRRGSAAQKDASRQPEQPSWNFHDHPWFQ